MTDLENEISHDYEEQRFLYFTALHTIMPIDKLPNLLNG